MTNKQGAPVKLNKIAQPSPIIIAKIKDNSNTEQTIIISRFNSIFLKKPNINSPLMYKCNHKCQYSCCRSNRS